MSASKQNQTEEDGRCFSAYYGDDDFEEEAEFDFETEDFWEAFENGRIGVNPTSCKFGESADIFDVYEQVKFDENIHSQLNF